MISLVLMPFVPLERPSLGVSLLKSVLFQSGMDANIRYANLEFAQRLGPGLSFLIKGIRNEQLLGEWIFAQAAFDHTYDAETYLDSLPWDSIEARFGDPRGVRAQLHQARELAREFVSQLACELVNSGVRLVGASSMFSQNCATLALFREIRNLDPEVVTVMGGPNCEGQMGRALVDNFPYLDFVVSGEAEELVSELFAGILRSGRSLTPLPEGVMAAGRGQPGRRQIEDMDSIPLPDFADYFQTLERLPLGQDMRPGLLVESSRGCWWGQAHHCTFCGLNGHGMNYRSKSPQRVVEEYASLAATYGLKKFEAVDNILDMKYLETVIPQWAQDRPGYEIFYEVKANLKREQLELLAQAGVRWLQPGIESLHSGPLKLMRKGTTPTINLALLKWARELGIWVVWNVLCGFPGEEEGWYAEMADQTPWLSHLQPPQGLSPLRYDRFSPYYTEAEEFRLRLDPSPAYRHIYPLEGQRLAEIAYYFVDRDRDSQRLREGGYLRLERALESWKQAFRQDPPAVCSLEDDGQEVTVFDTRPASQQRLHRLRGLPREVLLACHRPASATTLSRDLGRNWSDIEPVLKDLEASGLIYVDGQRYLGLPTLGELPQLPAPHDFPGGWYAPRA